MLEDHLRLKSPLIVQFEITPACNNNCRFCYNFWEYDNSIMSRKSPVNEKKITQLMDVLIEEEIPAICFTGGEPLLSDKILFGLIERANRKGMYTSINTNGRLITHDAAEKLKGLGLNSALVSLHGDSKQVHEEAVACEEAFIQTLKGIEKLVEVNLNTTVNYVSTQRNIDRIIPTAKLLKNLGVKNMTVTPLLPFPGVKDHQYWSMRKEQFRQYFDSLSLAKESGLKIDSTLPVAPCILKDMFPNDYQKYLSILSPRVCMAGVSFMVISPEGFNRACIQAPQLEEYGFDINKNFQKAWKNAYDWSALDLLPLDCTKCYALASCGGGCRTSSLAINNSTSGKTMYMGNPIYIEDAQAFIDRMEVKIDKNIKAFRKKNVTLREEEFGGVLANTSRQSFVMLDKKGVLEYNNLPDEFIAEGKGINVLYAAGIIEPSQNQGLAEFNGNISTIPASRFYSRLAGNMPLDDKVRMLRADTGERIYF
jgi:radical SAM protein with 4Fe4S-binding SPASM domain